MLGTFDKHKDKIAAGILIGLRSRMLTGLNPEVEDLAQHVVDNSDLSGFDDMAPSVESALVPAVERGGRRMIATLEVKAAIDPFNQVHDFALVFARDRAAELVGRINVGGHLIDDPDADMAITDSTRNFIRNAIVEALSPIKEGEKSFDLEQALIGLQDEITGGYVFSKARAKLIARAEIGMAQNQGALASLVALNNSDIGIIMDKKWSTAKDDKVCAEICAENAMAGPIPLDHVFPSGHMAPLGHPRCRCALIGVVRNTENEQ